MKIHPLLSELASLSAGKAANANVGFLHLASIFSGVSELAHSNPHDAQTLAKAGAYWAELLAEEMKQFQDSIDNVGETT